MLCDVVWCMVCSVCDCCFVCRWLGDGAGAAGAEATEEQRGVESKRGDEAAAA